MTTPQNRDGRRLAGLAALAGAGFMAAALALAISVTGSDTNMMLDPARALTLPPEKIAAFQAFLLADSLGYYLPFLIVGGYLWRRLRDAGAVIDMAAMALVVYVVLGLAGTSFQYATLPHLAAAHAAGDAATRAAAETTWLVTAWGTQKGLWFMEGPTFALWGLATGLAMRAQGLRLTGLLLMAAGSAYAASFVLFILGLDAPGELVVLLAVVLALVWSVATGAVLLREKSA
ncbi:MAG: hypothetical protein ACOY4K_11080 [Pseudomonadota bacterium]